LQGLSNEITALKNNDKLLKNKVVEIQKNMENFIDQQFKINKAFNSKISEIVSNLESLNYESYLL
jgi:hypothetical protein